MIHHKVRSNKQPSETMRRTMSLPVKRQGFPHLGHPSQKYSLNWEINQAGLGWLSLGNYFGYSTVLIKKKETRQNQTSFSMLQPAFHPNLVGLVEAFYDDNNLYLAYNYDGLAVSLSQVTTTPAVILGEPDIAGICRSILSGLEYLHEDLKMGHGNVQSSNILLCPDGVVKIGNP
ncbi:uncharacterized protein N7469_004599 [Penicillium citrinum]|uniref:Protein kinase domain-containing protein n=1 Tax=Penicillium citrinum TaxID=5077 RepID=A0A9W9TQR0_PENCI|nr:uncharacterized protein N7469_004599 [Penicillium citrinum]KAJ5235431.1 hypothetical protein N7469_004599 [Penicillium citrinum]